MLKYWLAPIDGLSPWRFYARVHWVVLKMIAVFYLISKSDAFFYQGF